MDVVGIDWVWPGSNGCCQDRVGVAGIKSVWS